MSEKDGPAYDLAKFQLKSILNNNSLNKTVCVLGTFQTDTVVANECCVDANIDNNKQAIIIFEKTAFTEQNLSTDCDENQRHYFSKVTNLKEVFINDIYGNFQCYPKPDINSKVLVHLSIDLVFINTNLFNSRCKNNNNLSSYDKTH